MLLFLTVLIDLNALDFSLKKAFFHSRIKNPVNQSSF